MWNRFLIIVARSCVVVFAFCDDCPLECPYYFDQIVDSVAADCCRNDLNDCQSLSYHKKDHGREYDFPCT